MQEILENIKKAVKDGDEDAVVRLVTDALAGDLSPQAILDEAMMPGMREIGEEFSRNEAFIPDLLISAEAMNAGVDILRAHLGSAIANRGRIILGTVQDDVHTIGKNLVRICLESAGYEVTDAGENITARDFAALYAAKKPDILGLSSLLSSTALFMSDIIKEVRALDPAAKIIVGGAPITQGFADKIGASGYARNAFDAVRLVEGLLK